MRGIIHHHNHRLVIRLVWCVVSFITTTIVTQINWYDVWYHSSPQSSALRLLLCVVAFITTTIVTQLEQMDVIEMIENDIFYNIPTKTLQESYFLQRGLQTHSLSR